MKKQLLNYRPVTWFVLAHRSNAVIYADKKAHPFYFIDRLDFQKAKKVSELVSDRSGRMVSSANKSIRHAYEPHESKTQHLSKVFTKEIAQYLEHARAEKLFDQLVLVSEPHFMGLLKKSLKPEIRNLIKHEIKHDYQWGSDAEIKKLIIQAIPMKEGHLNL